MAIQIEAIAEIDDQEIYQVVTQSPVIHDYVRDVANQCISDIDLNDLMRDYNESIRDIATEVFECEKDNLDIPDEFSERMLNNQNLGDAFVGYDDYIDQKHKMKTLEDSHARLQIQVMQMTTAFEKIGIAMDPFKRVPTVPVDVVGTTIVARTTFDG